MNIRDPDELRDKVKIDYESGVTYKEIEERYGVSKNTLSSWRKRYGWKKKKEGRPSQKGKVGAPIGNKNRLVHGLYSKYLPKETQEIMKEINAASPLDIMWESILMQYSLILRSQRIMHVKNKKDMTKELKKEKVMDGEKYSTEEKEYEIQFAWDKQANFLRAQSTAMGTLNRMIKEYDELLHKNWELATEEQRMRIDRLKAEVNKVNGTDNKDELNKLDQVLKEIKGVDSDGLQ